MRARGVKPCNDISIFYLFPDWKLCLIAVTVRILHANDRLRHRIHKVCMKSAEAYQIIFYLVLLKLQLFCIVHRLNLAAAAAFCAVHILAPCETQTTLGSAPLSHSHNSFSSLVIRASISSPITASLTKKSCHLSFQCPLRQFPYPQSSM